MADEKQPDRAEGAPAPSSGGGGASGGPEGKAPEGGAPSKEAKPQPPESADETGAGKPGGTGSGKPPAKPAGAKPAAAKAAGAAKAPPRKPPPKKPAVMETEPWDDELSRALKERFGDRISEFSIYRDQKFLVAQPDAVVPIIEHLKLEAEFDYLVDVTAVDYPKKEERFEVIYILYSFARRERIRIKTRIKDGQELESVVRVHPAANWLEREVFDMFGIRFAGHPDLRRILLPDEWEGHPLRKDSSILNMDQKWVQENLGIDSGQ